MIFRDDPDVPERDNSLYKGECVSVLTFIIGLVILIGGAALYGRFCEKVFGPDDRKTPAYTKEDGVDFVPMRGWKNSLINLLNIAGTGPILGPIQGILFGPIAFLTIPIGNVIGGAMHDYFSGMICLRDGGTQMPEMIRRYSTKGIYKFYNVFVCVLLLLVGAVFIYTPGDIAATQLFGFDGKATSVSTWVIYGVIFLYYLIATVFPIDAIIGKIYPIFGGILLFSAIGIFIGIFVTGMPLMNIWDSWAAPVLSLTGADGTVGTFTYADYFSTKHFLPIFFVTVACGILSGFHSTQTAIISRTMKSEKQGRMTFYNMMILEGFIAMIWAAAATYFFHNNGMEENNAAVVVDSITKEWLGAVGGVLAILGVIAAPITSGDTAFRSARLIVADFLQMEQKTVVKRLMICIPMFIVAIGILLYSQKDKDGFDMIWRYFAWSNQTLAVFTLWALTVYLVQAKKLYVITLIPALFMTAVCSTYIFVAPEGFGLSSGFSQLLGLLVTLIVFGIFLVWKRKKV